MIVAVGADHRGFALKERVKDLLGREGHTVADLGCHGPASVDYPDFARAVGLAVAAGRADLGVLVCGSGIGVSIAANKVRGVRAALCCNEEMAAATRRHNDANVICFGADHTSAELAERMVLRWLASAFEGGRHADRVRKIADIEQGGGGIAAPPPPPEPRGEQA
ncbi:MAG: ribose 5-phosphate isomerase B [bacterium]|nr:ribose 5-phosphate isomerase B [bacterium]MBK9303018.1 ribose 5-phosphate isomerase B [bacterium]